MTDFTKFEFGASFEVLWLKSPTSPSPKTLAIIFDRQLFDRINLDPGGVIVTAVGDITVILFRGFSPHKHQF
jgi:hypothetical protein